MSRHRYTPRHGRAVATATPAATPAATPIATPRAVATAGTAVVHAPGLGALLRRNPASVRHGAIGAIAAGLLLFGIGQSTGNALAVSHAAAPPVPSASVLPSVTASATRPAPRPAHVVRRAVSRQAVHASRRASASKAVISSLAANGIPTVALNAYRVAAARVDHADPGCGIDWALVAGIGREESNHGRFRGATLQSNGLSSPRIIGPALDGVHWDYIPAPANGQALDGDAKYAHALGPMQFIPSTWAEYGADATGDGVADVFNINDAALTTARYLCAAGGNLRTVAGQTAAVLAYNHNDQYLAQVLALADAYRRGIPITGIPVGNISGSLAPVKSGGYVPPANPGGPTAVDGSGDTSKSAGKPAPSRSSTPTPRSSTPSKPAPTAPKTSGTTGSASPSPSPTPTPTPSPTCDPLTHALGGC